MHSLVTVQRLEDSWRRRRGRRRRRCRSIYI
jgi:hypothetical protein